MMIPKLLAPHADRAYALLRIVSGFVLATGGSGKVMGVPGGPQMAFGTQLWIGGLIELVAGVAVMIGLFTSWAAFLLSGTMAVAYIQFHWKFQFDKNFFPSVNHGVAALVFCFMFLFMACKGPGPWSLDRKMGADRGKSQ